MSNKKLNEGDLMLRLTLPPEVELDAEDVEASVVGDEADEGEVGMDDFEDDVPEEGEVEDLGGEEEMSYGEDPEEELGEMEDYDEMAYESNSYDEIDDLFEGLSDDDVIEIDENMLRRELARLAEAGGACDPKVLDDFGGATTEKEPFTDAKDEDLNKHDDNNDANEVSAPKMEARLRKAGREVVSLKKENTEYKKIVHKLRRQLTETNLFNAKLLYTNKLLQNKGMSPNQKIAVVEAIDKAETLREVKLLYKSLTKSLGNNLGKNLAENKKRSKGSASKSAKPSGASKEVLEESNQSKRWAKLAGIMSE